MVEEQHNTPVADQTKTTSTTEIITETTLSVESVSPQPIDSTQSIDSTQLIDFATAQSTYKIITTLVEHVEASSNLVAMMASLLGPTATKQITETAAWAGYLTARRALEAVQPELHRFAVTVSKLAEAQPVASNEAQPIDSNNQEPSAPPSDSPSEPE